MFPSKLRASAQLSKMLGRNEPEKHDVNIGSQAELQNCKRYRQDARSRSAQQLVCRISSQDRP